MSLNVYQRKRDFSKTPEPSGKSKQMVGFSYVIQKHAASHLHFDFRLELDGVLKSWAVPKGPSLDPAVKRLAVEVEDHPVEYGKFEGTIPQGEYGGGTVMLWDRGTWTPNSDPHTGLQKGKLEFELFGEKLKGRWILLRTRRKATKPQWLLIKRNDDEVRADSDDDFLETMPDSVASGRTMEEIAANKAAKRRKSVDKETSLPEARHAQEERKRKPAKSAKVKTDDSKVSPPAGAKTAKFPAFIKPELATLVKEAPEGDEWLHEIKFDGYRMQCHIQSDKVSIYSRNGNDWTAKLPELANALKELPVQDAIVDGELVSVSDDGSTDFQSLQNAFRDKATELLSIYIFDLLYLNGKTLLGTTLIDRKATLETLLTSVDPSGPLQYSKHIVGTGGEFAKKAAELGVEGIVCKRLQSKYRSDRGSDWLKVKAILKDEFVIGGYTAPEGSRVGLGALLVGYYDDQDRLLYAGKVGTGFDNKTLKLLHSRLKGLNQTAVPFDVRASAAHPPKKAIWVKPELVAQIHYGSLTRDHVLRHAVYEGLREDKPANQVILDKALPVKAALTKSASKKDSASTKEEVQKQAVTKRKAKPTTERKSTSKSLEEFEGVRLSSQDKVLYPTTGTTKRDLASYYRDMADWILPHIDDRPLVLVRCPDGVGETCFYQKHPGPGTPNALRQISIQEKNETNNYVVVDNRNSLISLAQIGSVELHAWGSTEKNLEKPDRLIFDLDPDESVDWKHVVNGAKQIRKLLDQLGLKCFVKTTGGKGLHVVVPIERRQSWDEAKLFSRLVAQFIQSDSNGLYTLNMSKQARKGKIFIDYLRNDRGSTSVAPYSPRAREGAPVSTPIAWEELNVRLRSDRFTVANIGTRIAS